MRIRAIASYDAGVDGLWFWDCQKRSQRLSGWAMHSQLGHRDELEEMKPFADSLFRREPLVTLTATKSRTHSVCPSDG